MHHAQPGTFWNVPAELAGSLHGGEPAMDSAATVRIEDRAMDPQRPCDAICQPDALLDKEPGKDYVNFGFTFHEGCYTGIAPDEQQRWLHDAQTAYPGTLKYLLHQLDEPIFLLDLRRMHKERFPILEWINQMEFRYVGVVKVKKSSRTGMSSTNSTI